jgi:hypothetical protein
VNVGVRDVWLEVECTLSSLPNAHFTLYGNTTYIAMWGMMNREDFCSLLLKQAVADTVYTQTEIDHRKGVYVVAMPTGDSLVEKEATLLGNNSFPASSNIDVVIATPGRLAEHLSRGSFVALQFLRLAEPC